MSTRDRLGTRVGPMRLAWTAGRVGVVIFFLRRGSNQHRSFADGFLEAGDDVLQRLHFRERQQKGQRGLGALVLAQTVHVQAVPTTAGGRIVEGEAQVVSTEEP